MVEGGRLVWQLDTSDKFWVQQAKFNIRNDLRASLTREKGPVLDYTIHHNVIYK